MSRDASRSVLDSQSIFNVFGYESGGFDHDDIFHRGSESLITSDISGYTNTIIYDHHHRHGNRVIAPMDIDGARRMSVDSSLLGFANSRPLLGSVIDEDPMFALPIEELPSNSRFMRRRSHSVTPEDLAPHIAHLNSVILKSFSQSAIAGSNEVLNSKSVYENKQSSQYEKMSSFDPAKRAEQAWPRRFLRSISSSPNLKGLDAATEEQSQPECADNAIVKKELSSIVPVSASTLNEPTPSPASTVLTNKPTIQCSIDAHSSVAPISPTSDFLTRTRRLGAWLSGKTEGKPMNLSQKEMNAVFPNTF